MKVHIRPVRTFKISGRGRLRKPLEASLELSDIFRRSIVGGMAT